MKGANLTDLTGESFQPTVATGIWVVDFWSETCAPCKILSPMLEEFSLKIKEISFARLNVDDEPELAGRWDIVTVPTIVLLRDGVEQDRILGLLPGPQLRKIIEQEVRRP